MKRFDELDAAPLRLDAENAAPVPWLNGKGMTRELASRTTREGLMLWRISIGELPEPALFSTYREIDRLFTALGEMTLTIDGTPTFLAAGDQVRFPGEAAVSVAPAFPTRALNVMTRRTWARPQVKLVSVRDSGRAGTSGPVDLGSEAVDAVVDVDEFRAHIRFNPC